MSYETATAVHCKLWHQIPHLLEVRTFRGKSSIALKEQTPHFFHATFFIASSFDPPRLDFFAPLCTSASKSAVRLMLSEEIRCWHLISRAAKSAWQDTKGRTGFQQDKCWEQWQLDVLAKSFRWVPTMPPATTPGMQDVPPDINMDANAVDQKGTCVYLLCMYIYIYRYWPMCTLLSVRTHLQ